MSFQFRGQRVNEEVQVIIRQHPISFLFSFLKALSPLVVPVLLYFFVALGSIFFGLIIFCLILSLTLVYMVWYRWFNTIVLVTNERFIYLRQVGFVNRELTECSLSSVQQINHKINGIFRTLFNFGAIEISLSGTNGSLRVDNIPNPYDFQQEVLRVAKGDIFLADNFEEGDE